MTPAAGAAAATAEDLGIGGDAAFFQSLADVGADEVRHFLEGVLGFHESRDQRVGLRLLLEALEGQGLRFRDGLSAVVLLFILLTRTRHLAVESHGAFISEEGLGLSAGGLDFAVFHDGGTEFVELFFDGSLGASGHKTARLSPPPAPRHEKNPPFLFPSPPEPGNRPLPSPHFSLRIRQKTGILPPLRSRTLFHGMFDLLHTDPRSSARRGRMTLAHGVVETPIFMPVGTQATVKAMAPWELEEIGASIILGNTYHLNLRPGMDVIRQFGSLHRFMNWQHPILTDSGGFQVFSLAKLRKLTEEGVRFQSHIDGSPLFLSPEVAMEIQATLGSDIAMVLDECPPWPCDEAYASKSLDLTLRWARRCREWKAERAPLCDNGLPQRHFGIVQGSVFAGLRERAARELVAMDFDGYAIGGVSVGESEEEMLRAVDNAVPFLPADKPRYTMGVGTPPQLLEMIARGVDMFDCVLPTRVARHGSAFTTKGMLNMRNACFAADQLPLDPGCTCSTCRHFSRGYVRHLIKAGEILGLRLVTQHNLHFYLTLMQQARDAITAGIFIEFKTAFISSYTSTKTPA